MHSEVVQKTLDLHRPPLSTIERARGKEIEKETTVAARIQASPTILLLLFFFVL